MAMYDDDDDRNRNRTDTPNTRDRAEKKSPKNKKMFCERSHTRASGLARKCDHKS